MSLSPTKTCAIQFRRTGVPNSNTQISLNNTNVPIQDSVKLLGLYLDHDLSWTSHLFHLRQKLASSLYALNRCKHFLTPPVLRLMYYGLFYPHLCYGIILWGSANMTRLKPIIVLQKKAIRAIHHRPPLSHTSTLFQQANILKLSDLHRIECINMMHRLTNSTLPKNLEEFFPLNNTFHQHNTRQALLPHHVPFRTSWFKTCYLYHTKIKWQSVPPQTRDLSWEAVKSWARLDSIRDY